MSCLIKCCTVLFLFFPGPFTAPGWSDGEFPGAPAVRIGQDSVPRLIVGCTEASKRSLVVRPLRCQGVRGNQRLVGKTPALESSHYPRYQNGSVGCEHMSIEREMADSAGASGGASECGVWWAR